MMLAAHPGGGLKVLGKETNQKPPKQVLLLFLFYPKDQLHYTRLLSGVAPANQTKKRSVHELFAGAFRNKSSM